MLDEVDRLAPMCAAIARLLSPHAEVVLHSPATDRIVGIWNPLSGRSVGDPSLLGELSELTPAEADVYGPYPKALPDGRRLSSVSAILRDPDLVFCINFDRTVFDDAVRIIGAFAAPLTGQPKALFERDWTETLNSVVGEYVREIGVPVDRLSKQDRSVVLDRLVAAGIFEQRRSVPAVARALGMSRSAVYQLLAEARRGSDAS